MSGGVTLEGSIVHEHCERCLHYPVVECRILRGAGDGIPPSLSLESYYANKHTESILKPALASSDSA